MILVLDCETTGLPRNYQAPVSDLENWPQAMQIAWGTYENNGNLIEFYNSLVWSLDFRDVSEDAIAKHGITIEKCMQEGRPLAGILDDLRKCMSASDFIVAHNIDFDASVLGAEFLRLEFDNPFEGKNLICTMKESTDFCAIGNGRGGNKWPKLSELHQILFQDEPMLPEHDAANDVATCAKCFFELVRLDVIRLTEPVQVPELSTKIGLLASIRKNAERLQSQKTKMLEVVTKDALYLSVDAQLKEIQGVEKILTDEIRADGLAQFKIDQVKAPGLGYQVKCFKDGKLTYDPKQALAYCLENLKPALALDVKTFEGFAKSGKLPESIVKVEDDFRVQIDSDLSAFIPEKKDATETATDQL